MYSGEDSSGDALTNKNMFSAWPLGQPPCIMNNDRIDWAALAQQWIQMKESCTDEAATQKFIKTVERYEEQGEAPMEVVKDDEIPVVQNSSSNVPAAPTREWSTTAWYPSEQAQLSTNWENWSTVTSTNATQLPTVQPADFFKTSNIPLLKSGGGSQNSELPPMDVAKKKTLPAWIREGLEKMEKEKLKQLEKSRSVDHSSRGSNPTLEEECVKDILKSASDDSNSNHEKVDYEISNPRESVEIQRKSKEEIAEELALLVRKSLTELLLEVTNEEILGIAQESFRKYKSKATSAQVFRKSAISSITGKLGLGAYADSASENSESESDNPVNEIDSEDEIKENIRLRQSEFKAIAQDIELRIRQFEEKQQGEKEVVCSSSVETDGLTRNCIKDSGETQPDKKGQSDDKRSKERTSRFSATKDTKQKYNSYVVQATAIPCSSYDYNKRKTKAASRRASYSSDTSSDNGGGGSSSYKKSKRRLRSKGDKNWREGSQCDSNLPSSDSDEHKKRKHRKSHKKERSRSRSHSRSSSRSYSSKRSEKRY